MMRKVPKLKLLSRSASAFLENDLTSSAAAISYFTMLTLFPALLLLLALGSDIFGQELVERYIIGQVLAFLPGAEGFVRSNLQSIPRISSGMLASCLLVMLWAASWTFTVLEKALNRIWGSYPRSFFHGRAVNLALMTLVSLLLGTLAFLTAFATGVKAATEKLPFRIGPLVSVLSGYMWNTAFILISGLLTIGLFTFFYKWLPNTKIPFREAMPGAIVAGIAWEGAKYGFAYMLPYIHYDRLYGSIGAAVAILSWVYLSSLIILYGAQFTALLHRDHLLNPPARGAAYASGLATASDSNGEQSQSNAD